MPNIYLREGGGAGRGDPFIFLTFIMLGQSAYIPSLVCLSFFKFSFKEEIKGIRINI